VLSVGHHGKIIHLCTVLWYNVLLSIKILSIKVAKLLAVLVGKYTVLIKF